MSENAGKNSVRPADFLSPDGRTLHLYGPYLGTPDWKFGAGDHGTAHSHMRWHPLRREWVVYSAHRQSRTYKPSSDCPFCPKTADGEIPFDDFSVAVLDNRFSSFQKDAVEPPPLEGLRVGKALGTCEVIVYSADHRASMASLTRERRELLVKVWGDRVRSLMALPYVQAVLPFENRGEEAGVTLHHPHGQIYAFSYIPPVFENMLQSFREGASVSMLAGRAESLVSGTDTMSAVVPPFARFPYEVWIAPKRFVSAPDGLNADEVRDCAFLLGDVQARYDKFFGRVCAYVMAVYSAPRGAETFFPFHIQYFPLLRTPQKLKFIAGVELGAGSFLVDVLPEEAARSLRSVRV